MRIIVLMVCTFLVYGHDSLFAQELSCPAQTISLDAIQLGQKKLISVATLFNNCTKRLEASSQELLELLDQQQALCEILDTHNQQIDTYQNRCFLKQQADIKLLFFTTKIVTHKYAAIKKQNQSVYELEKVKSFAVPIIIAHLLQKNNVPFHPKKEIHTIVHFYLEYQLFVSLKNNICQYLATKPLIISALRIMLNALR